MAIEHADFEGIERLAAVLGAEIRFAKCVSHSERSFFLKPSNQPKPVRRQVGTSDYRGIFSPGSQKQQFRTRFRDYAQKFP